MKIEVESLEKSADENVFPGFSTERIVGTNIVPFFEVDEFPKRESRNSPNSGPKRLMVTSFGTQV